jgi:PST family polysaccharide transporter
MLNNGTCAIQINLWRRSTCPAKSASTNLSKHVTTQVERKVAVGAVWMIGMRLFDRSIGFVSTLILARLLIPADFGLVAMAMAVYGFIEMGGQFGFDIAIIRNRQASRAHYDSAWTLSVGYGLFTALALTALAVPSAIYFNEPRLDSVIFVLAAMAMIQGFANIGTVEFRKNFRFGTDFLLTMSQKVSSFVVTIALAYSFRSYWALLGGIATSRVTGVLLSYWLHPFRPRFDRSKIGELLSFSRWIVLRGFIEYVLDRGPDFLIGRFFNASALGLYRVSREISTLPTTELLFPIMRAVFPGYAAVANDRKLLASTFLLAQGSIVTLTLPAGMGIVMLADPIVRLLLGPNWLEAIPLIQILGLFGVVTVFQATNMSIFNVLGKPHWNAALKAGEVTLLVPGIFVAYKMGYGLEGLAWAIFGSHAVVVPVGIFLIERLLQVGFRDRFAVAWRPLLATAIMSIVLWWRFTPSESLSGAKDSALLLVVAIPVGACIFAGSILLLWKIAGMPNGPERKLLGFLREKLGAWRHARK